ncbi:glycosyltransferase family 2 protein [Mycetocola tolaasinivorans]|uniref:glycosyltransferase family 2 protein n=1 Tax=Mycetocola tolaasinivorans TaxID=76635 RepID=UPI0016025BC5|nr:glycosyltransferase family A protein [Mycetocola tolaasinivorans]
MADVTCVIPTHDRDVSLKRAVESVLGQTQQPKRIVVVDDLGADSTRALVESYAAVVYIDGSQIDEKSAGSSRNLGARNLSTKWIAFLDDDDEWAPTFLEELFKAAERRPAISLLVSWSDLSYENGRLVPASRMAEGHTQRDVVAKNPGFTGSNFLIRASTFRELGGFDGSLWVANDLDFITRYLGSKNVYGVVQESLVLIGVGDGQEHLTSRSRRHAEGIKRYLSKHRGKANFIQRRPLLRRYHLASRYPGQSRTRAMGHFALQLFYSSPKDILVVIERRLRGDSEVY